ncbi:hypothetical protein MTO96_047913 [Rhipicephalus appendiculatus]
MRKWFGGGKNKQNEPGAQIASEKSGHPSKVSSPTGNAASPQQPPQQQQAGVQLRPANAARNASLSSPDASEEDTQTSLRSSTGTAVTLASGKVQRRHSVDSKKSARHSAQRDPAILWDGRGTCESHRRPVLSLAVFSARDFEGTAIDAFVTGLSTVVSYRDTRRHLATDSAFFRYLGLLL